MADPIQCCHSPFDRLITFDWYDGLVEGVVRCGVCESWFHCWLIVWAPGTSERMYALQPIDIDVVNRVVSLFDEEPNWPRWLPRFDDSSRTKIGGLFEAPVASTQSLLVGCFTDLLGAVGSLRWVEPRELGQWAQPRDIEAIVDQDAHERRRLQALAAAPNRDDLSKS